MQYFAGIDIGTTHTKLVITDHRLAVVYQAKKAYTKGFGARLDAGEILGHCRDLLASAAEHLPADARALHIGCSAAMHSLVLTDQQGQPLTELITWADNSSASWVDNTRKNHDTRALFLRTGTPFHPMTPLAKLGWISENDPALHRHFFKAVGIKEFIWFHLTGAWEIDPGIASATGLFSIDRHQWDEQALQLAGVTIDRLSIPVSHLHRRAIDFAVPAFLVAGGSDGCLAQLGSNLLTPDAAALTIGTSGAIRVTKTDTARDPEGQLFTYLLDDEFCVQGAPINNGGMALQWWNHQVAGGSLDAAETMAAFEKDLAATTPGADGLLCIPWFGGERAPVWDASATGSFHRITQSHQRSHFGRAILEGICLHFRWLTGLLENNTGELHSIYASGGFTASKAWLQLMADVLQKTILVPASPVDASALGAIAMAMRASGEISNWNQFVERNRQPMERYTGLAYAKAVYDPQYSIFRELCRS